MTSCFNCPTKRELLSLRAKVKNFEEGHTFSVLSEENGKLKEKLEVEKARNLKKAKEIKELKKKISDLNNTNHSQEWELRVTKRELDKYSNAAHNLVEANNKIAELEAKVQKLTAQVNMDFTTSSIPSSKCIKRSKITNCREKTGKKQGGQPGHKGNARKQLKANMPSIYLPAPDEVIENPDNFIKVDEKRRKSVDLHIHVSVTEYVSEVYQNKITGEKTYREFPNHMSNEINYGSGIKALCILLNNYANVPLRKTAQLLSDITGGDIEISIATINSLAKNFSKNTEEFRKKLFSDLVQSPYLHNDATVLRVNGKQQYAYITSNGKQVLYQLREHKGYEGLKGTPIEFYLGTIISDHDKTYFHYGTAHQKCLAHELRYLKGSIENEPDLTWNKKMHELLQNVIHQFKQGEIYQKQIYEILDKFNDIIELAEKEYEGKEAQLKYYDKGFNTYKRLSEYRENVFYFLDHPDIPYTNSEAERRARRSKSKMNVIGGFRSSDSTEYYLDFMDFIETKRDEDINLYEEMKAVFDK